MPATLSERVHKRRQTLRAAGLRPIEIWVPDTRAPGFAEEYARQSRVIAESASEKDIMDFIEQASDGAWD
ncbi:antitoxin MazE family protein [Paraburkholderia hospita]|jgi:hypothetical protein|uniref:antitoxin MazE family protein n=1 Tax=Paraburkholderia hospita TaxID=169430 RepID=UPI003ECF0101